MFEETTIVQKDSRELSDTQISQYKDLELAANKEYIPQFGIRIVHKKVGSLTNILYLYR